MELELRQLECFIAVAEERHFGRAAVRLHMTQPPLTRRIKRLERELGATLFVRTPQGVDITPSGQALLEQAHRVMGLVDRAVAATRSAEAGESGELVIAYFGSVIFDVVTRLLGDFHRRYPHIELRVAPLAKDVQVDAIRDGLIHIGFARRYGDEPGLDLRHVADEPLYVALSDGHPFARHLSLRLRQLRREPLVLFPRGARPSYADGVLQTLSAEGIQPDVRLVADDLVSALVAVATGAGVAVVPRAASNLHLPGVRYVPLDDARVEYVTCAYRLGGHRAPVLGSLLEFMDQWRPAGGPRLRSLDTPGAS
jgi:DNA-binding transcriptional LysR family regulator